MTSGSLATGVRRAIYAVCLGALIGACSDESRIGPESDRSVRFAFGPDSLSTVYLFAAEERGLFESAGINTEHIELASGNDQLNALLSGHADVLPAVSIVPVLHLEIGRPGTVRIFAHSLVTSDESFDKVIVGSDSDMRELEDLSGHRVGVFPGTTATRLFRALLVSRGIDPTSVSFVPLPSHIQLASLQSGAVDALLSYEPATTVALRSGEFRVLYGSVNAALMEAAPTGVSVLARRFERESPVLARRVVDTLDGGVLLARREPQALRALLPLITEMPADVAEVVHINRLTLSSEVDAVMLQRFIELLHDIGEIPEVISAQDLVAATR